MYSIDVNEVLEINKLSFDGMSNNNWTVDTCVYYNIESELSVIELSSSQNSTTYTFGINSSNKPI